MLIARQAFMKHLIFFLICQPLAVATVTLEGAHRGILQCWKNNTTSIFYGSSGLVPVITFQFDF